MKNKEPKFRFEEIVYCQKEPTPFQNEYVFDIEVDDDTHTFIANDILVHNSAYVEFKSLFDTIENLDETKYKGNELDFILDFYNFRFKDYLQKAFDKFSDERNTENYQNFELESIAKSAVWVAKKKYFQDVVWEDPGVKYESLKNVKYKGIEVIQSSTPSFVRGELKKILIYILSADHVSLDYLIEKLKVLKKAYIEEPNINKKCKNIKVNDYDKYCVNDKTKFEFGKKCPAHVRGSIYYNYKLNNSEYKDKYTNIQAGDKVKVYYSLDKTCDIFSFIADSYPKEFAPKFDYDVMFFKTVIEPINSILASIGLQEITSRIEYKKSVF